MKGRIEQLDWTWGNIITLLDEDRFFSALCSAIDAAKVSIHLETYIFYLDRIGLMVLKCLENAASRGIKIRIVLDGFGCQSTIEAINKRLSPLGVQCRVYRPEPRYLRHLILSRRRLHRLHRKVTVIDSDEAFIGGINIAEDFNESDEVNEKPIQKLDFAVKVRGPLVSYVIHAQDWLWLGINWTKFRFKYSEWRYMRFLKPRHSSNKQTKKLGGQRAALVLRDNIRYRQTFERAYMHAIKNANSDIIIANAYFFPRAQFIKELTIAANRGVRVRLLLQGKAEYKIQYRATRAIYRKLLHSGIEIYEYMPSILHAKVAVIDNIAFVGSSNLDPFSLLLAREANVIVEGNEFVSNLRQRLELEILQGGYFVEQKNHSQRNMLHRLADAFSYKMFRIIVALTGSSNNY